jgi:hypothetical protein
MMTLLIIAAGMRFLVLASSLLLHMSLLANAQLPKGVQLSFIMFLNVAAPLATVLFALSIVFVLKDVLTQLDGLRSAVEDGDYDY